MAAADRVLTGVEAKVYQNGGTPTTPTWTAVDRVRSVTANQKWNRADSSARESRAVLQAKTQIALSGTIEVRATPADAGYDSFYSASCLPSESALDLMILDGPITQEGSRGVRAFMNLDGGQNQGIGDVLYTTFDYDPAWNKLLYPSRVAVGATGTLTYTAW
jgi:hypothetical protein